jgi:hypothetical protein
MRKKTILKTVFATIMLLFVSLNGNAQTKKTTPKKVVTTNIEIIQFHSEHRCITCNLIEKLTKETLKSYPSIQFLLVNVDDAKNEKISEQFEATGTALFLYNQKTGKKKDLTDFAFMNAKSKPQEFKKGLAKEINSFK